MRKLIQVNPDHNKAYVTRVRKSPNLLKLWGGVFKNDVTFFHGFGKIYYWVWNLSVQESLCKWVLRVQIKLILYP